MTCAEIQELLSGYILDALEPHEMDAVEAHLAECRAHDDELVDLRATGMALALLDDAGPSAGLRERIRAIPGGGPVLLRPVLPALDHRDGLPDRDDAPGGGDDGHTDAHNGGPWSTLTGRHAWWLAGAAAVIALVIFGAGWYAGARSVSDPTALVRYSYEMRGPNGQLVRFAGIEGSERVTVTMDGLQPQPDGQQYQVWAIRDGKWITLGHCNTNQRGWWKGDFEFKLNRGEEVALTVEPTGGSARPSTPAILRTKF